VEDRHGGIVSDRISKSKLSRTFPPVRIMNFRFKQLQNSPADICEGEIRICSSQFKELTGQSASANRLKPWKGRVVALTSPAGTIYRVVKGHGKLSIP
jgi:hypothetical protein